ncbi:MAG: hypothetical protein CMO41_04535 [Verrucomicrobiales bacterium]|nr:hypothetical protein [Verrucomicrobiales bacterium]|tara:strand:+ start:2268 stop:2654 length:387 start_codon:yes stop_codon:yes gene_type:complete
MLSSYYIELRTGVDYDRDTYDAAAGRMTFMCAAILSDRQALASLTHNAQREDCHSEIEVGLDVAQDGSRELVAKAIVDIVAPQAVKFDKSKLTKLLKARPECDEWKAMKIYKKMVPQSESLAGSTHAL